MSLMDHQYVGHPLPRHLRGQGMPRRWNPLPRETRGFRVRHCSHLNGRSRRSTCASQAFALL